MKSIFSVIGALWLAGCAVASDTQGLNVSASESCIASVYWEGFGRPLADGRRHSPDDVLVAHRSLSFGVSVRITSITSGRAIVAPVADRGPYVRGRCVDLSLGAARALGVSGLDRVRVEIVDHYAYSSPVESQTPESPILKLERKSR